MIPRIAAFICIAAVLFAVAPLFSHPVPFSYVNLSVGARGVEGTLTAHVEDWANELSVAPPDRLLDSTLLEAERARIHELIRSRFHLAADGVSLLPEFVNPEPLPDKRSVTVAWRGAWERRPGLLRFDCALFPYDPQHRTFLTIYEAEKPVHQEIFSRNHLTFEYYTGSRQGALLLVRKFLQSGVWHIFLGLDHVLFIVGLILLGGGIGRLFRIVTAFTLAHSITLTLAALNIVSAPPRIIEPAVALSIIYIGAENLIARKDGRDFRAWVAFSFGFIHGFAFANVLQEFGLPSRALAWALFSFNLGVEVGQACIVVVAALLLSALRRRDERLALRLATAISVLVMMAGSYWFVRRVFFQG